MMKVEKRKRHGKNSGRGCKKSVKSFKIKLCRKVSCLTGKSKKPIVHAVEYLEANKYEG